MERQFSLRTIRIRRGVFSLSAILSVLLSFSIRGMGGTGSIFGAASDLPEPARSSLLLELWRVRFFGVLIWTFVTQLGSFVLGTSTMNTQVFFFRKILHWPQRLFLRSFVSGLETHGFSLSLSRTPPLSLLLMPERPILLPFDHEPFAIHCRQSVTLPFRGTAGDGAADTARSPKKKSSSFSIIRTAKDLSFVVTPRLLFRKNLRRMHLQRFWHQ